MKKIKFSFKAALHGTDKVFLLCVILLSLFGTVMVFSSGYAYSSFRYGDAFYFVKRQSVFLVLGLLIMPIAASLPASFYKKLAFPLYVLTVVLLLLVLAIGMVGNGAQRWISIGPVTIQPSEIAKLTMVMMLAKYYSYREEKQLCRLKIKKNDFVDGTLIPCLIMLLPILLVMLQKHLSCIIILGTIGILLIVLSGANLKYIGVFSLIGALGVSYIALFTDYTKDRITVWQNPEAYKLTGGWQTLQGLIAIGSGGLFGKGLFKGELKYCYVSEPANDMIFAILCEEVGFVGALLAIILFGALVFLGYSIGFKTDDTFARLLTLGIITKVAVQTLLNIAVVTNTIPNTGISLPFFSYGGSSLLMLFIEMGIVLSVSKEAKIKK